MRIQQSKRTLREEWTKWYAWHPVQCEMADGTWAWVCFEAVERKETYGYGGHAWRYREALSA